MTEREREIYEDSLVYEEESYVWGAEDHEEQRESDGEEDELWYLFGD